MSKDVRPLGFLGAFVGALVVVATAGDPLTLAAQPSWEQVSKPLYVILRHSEYGELWEREGLWRFDTTNLTYTRVRPFYYNPRSVYGDGWGSYLSGYGDRLLFESWPAMIEFDAATGRVVRRWSPMADRSLHGWGLQGPALSPDVARAAGLAPGIYGFPQCFYLIRFYGDEPFPCVRYQYPGSTGATEFSSRVHVETRGGADGLAEWHLFADLTPATTGYTQTTGWLHQFFTFDPTRNGFWRVLRNAATFFPVRDGALDLVGRQEVPLPDLLTADGWEVRALQYHPAAHRFYARRFRNPPSMEPADDFVELNESLALDRTIGTYELKEGGHRDPVPWTFASLASSPPTTHEQIVPIIANAPGRRGTYWTAELWLYNPSAEATTVSLRRVVAPAVQREVALPPHGSLKITDALSWIGGGPGGDGTTHDGLVATSPYRWGEQVVLASRSSTPSADPNERARGGSMGHGVVAVPGRTGYSNHLVEVYEDSDYFTPSDRVIGHAAEFVLDRRDPEHFRHNLGYVNDDDQPLTITLHWGVIESYGPPRPEGTVQSVTVAPHSVGMIWIESLFPQVVRDTWPARLWVRADRPAVLSLSMVDNITGDATYVPYTLFFMCGDDETRYAIPAIAHLPGENGTFWKTDFYGAWFDDYNGVEGDGVRPDWVKAFFHPSRPDANCGGSAAGGGEISGYLPGVVSVPNGQWSWWDLDLLAVYPDVTQLFAQCAGDLNVRGALEVRAGSWMAGYARNYTTRADGGTYGDMLPLYPPHGWPVQHFAGIEMSPRYRVNLGLFNGDREHTITYRLLLFDQDGHPAGQREVSMAPWENRNERLEELLGLEVGSLPDGTYGLTVLPLDDPDGGVEGRSWAFVSLVDNVTGDPTHWW